VILAYLSFVWVTYDEYKDEFNHHLIDRQIKAMLIITAVFNGLFNILNEYNYLSLERARTNEAISNLKK
jgi:hypothetical protein